LVVGGCGAWPGMGGPCEGAGWVQRQRNARNSGLASSRVLVLLHRGHVLVGCHRLCEVHVSARHGVDPRGIRGLELILSRGAVRALCSAFLCNPRRPILGPSVIRSGANTQVTSQWLCVI